MSQKKSKYGIMGGTFDPIHIGHLVIAEEIRNRYELDKVIFIPSGNPPHKDLENVTFAKHRYEMTLLATATNPHFEVSSIEVDREGLTYTVDTIKFLKEKCDDDIEFYFITGADAILDLPTWKNVSELLELCKFVAATRPGFDMNKMQTGVEALERKYNKSIYTTVVPALKISSTNIRERIAKGYSVKYLLPEIVENYIYKHNIYSKEKSY